MTEKKKWDIKRTLKQQRIKSVHSITEGKVIPTENIVEVMEKLSNPVIELSSKAIIKNRLTSWRAV